MADDNTISFKGFEGKKWIISRIDLIHESVRDEITSIEHRFDETGKKELSRLRGWRNDISYGLGIVLTLLIAVKQFYTNWDLLSWMIVTGISIGISLIVFNSFIGFTERLFLNLIKQIQIAKGSIDWSKSFFTVQTRDLDTVNMEYLKAYSDFAKYVAGVSMISILFGLVQGYKIWLKRDIKKEFQMFAEPITSNIESGKRGYLQMDKSEFEFPQALVNHFDDLIKQYDMFKNITEYRFHQSFTR